MKVCFIDWFAYGLFNPKSKIVFGGAQIQLYFLAKALAKDSQNQVYFLTDNGKNQRRESYFNLNLYQFVRSPKNSGLKGRLLAGYWYFFLRLLIQLAKINADVYVQRAASAETGIIAMICKLLRKKFIYMVAHKQDTNGSFINQNGWRGKLFQVGLNLADQIICQTRQQQNQLTKRLRFKSTIIASGYPLLPVTRQTKKKRGILWVARAEQWKRPDLFIQLASKFPQQKFTMICPPAENNPDYFNRLKIQAQKTPNLNFINHVPFRKINAYFQSALIFVSTSESEGFPNTFLQAGNHLTAILSYKVNPDKIFSRYKLGLCAQGDEKLLTINLRRLLANQKLRNSLATNLHSYVSQNHDINQTSKKFTQLLTKT